MKKIYISNNEAETAAVANKLAKITKRGDIWALSGTLGMGKSVFARAFIQTLSDAEEVPSPTFTLVQTYRTQMFDIYHYDLYRLKEASEIFELGVEEAFYEGVSLVEWPEKMGAFAPRNMWHVIIEADGEKRKITISTDDEQKIKRLADV
jgi:tRNA threonylcarbamoyladenosine biosynthesis protein TsaE